MVVSELLEGMGLGATHDQGDSNVGDGGDGADEDLATKVKQEGGPKALRDLSSNRVPNSLLMLS